MLQLSEERFKALITVLEESDKAFVGDIQRDAVAQAQADIFFQLGLRDKDLMKWGFNQIGVMKGQYHTATLDIVSKFQAGTYSYDKAFGLWKDVSKRTVEGMYRAGAATVGNPFYKELKIPGRDLRLMSKYMRREGKFFKGLLSDIRDPKHVPIVPTDATGKRLPGYRLQKFDYLTRAGMYPESLEAMRYNGMLMGAGRNIEIRWVLGVPMTEHCIDCPTLAMRVWLPETLPTVPRAGDTKCLWKCYCHLEPRQRFMRTTFDIAGRATEGAIRALGRNARVYDTAGHEIGGQLQREIEYWQAQEYKARQMMSIAPKNERMFWIGERKRFNRLIIDRAKAGSYRVVPTVSVSALTKTIKAAARKGGTLTAIENLMVGDEVWFARSDYSSFGVIGIRNGVRVFKSPTGVVLNVDATTDVIFATQPNWRPSATLESANKWAKDSVMKDTVYHGTTKASAGVIHKSGFSKVEQRSGIYGWGTYVTPVRSGARGAEAYAKEGGLLKIKLNVKNPIELTSVKGSNIIAKLEKKFAKKFKCFASDPRVIKAWSEELERMGYDAVWVKSVAADEWVIFDPKNIMVIRE